MHNKFNSSLSRFNMIKRTIFIFLLSLLCFSFANAQVPIATHIQIVKAEDARHYDAALEKLLKSPNPAISKRAMLAAGRIGDEKALPVLIEMMDKATTADSAAMAAFAIGEIESINGADALLKALGAETSVNSSGAPKLKATERVTTRFAGVEKAPAAGPLVTARLLEAAGKIAAAHATDPRSKQLGAAVVKTLETELKSANPSAEVCRLGLTAVLRSRPAGSEETVRKFLAFTDPNVVADALNTLARLRAKNANRDARDLLETHLHAVVRANAARVLGAADDKEAVDVLIKAATSDTDSRVRVSAIRALGAIKVAKSAEPLLARGEALLDAYKKNLKPNFIPVEQNEFIEVSNAIGQVLAKTGNARAVALFTEFLKIDNFNTVEPYVARVKIGGIRPGSGLTGDKPIITWRQYSTLVQTIGELAAYEPENDAAKKIKDEAPEQLRKLVNAFINADPTKEPEAIMAAPDALQAFARFKTEDVAEIARTALQNKDVQIRAAAAGILADLPASKENIEALKTALEYGRVNDIISNDAILATLDAIIKLDPKLAQSLEAVTESIISPDHLVRQKVRDVLPPEIIKITSHQLLYEVTPYFGVGTKVGQVLNKDADYRRALSRKNGTVSAVLTTSKGNFTIDLLPEDAPLTVDNFIKLARSGYFNGLEVHRVVPNFVMQDGDPRGDGNGGPGWSIRCEVNMVSYERGAVGMALSGKDTGGSQWFVTHSPQPHLDGGYTVFGRVNETGMKVVDNIVRGDKIISVRIMGK
jgi:cyclophilin family peptidyl-prolyl cis-trans isomerase/HEAT repeat protein